MKRIYFDGEKSKYRIDYNLNVYNDRGKVTQPILWSQGRYEMYSFNHKGKKVRRLRHRLIGEYFLKIPDGYKMDELQINHIDGDKLNNTIQNLEWVTQEENIRHSFKNNLSPLGGKPYKRLEIEDTITGKKEIFPSIRQASLHTDMSIGILSRKSNISKQFTVKHYKIKMLEDEIQDIV